MSVNQLFGTYIIKIPDVNGNATKYIFDKS